MKLKEAVGDVSWKKNGSDEKGYYFILTDSQKGFDYEVIVLKDTGDIMVNGGYLKTVPRDMAELIQSKVMASGLGSVVDIHAPGKEVLADFSKQAGEISASNKTNCQQEKETSKPEKKEETPKKKESAKSEKKEEKKEEPKKTENKSKPVVKAESEIKKALAKKVPEKKKEKKE
jgi:hypothetical protein